MRQKFMIVGTQRTGTTWIRTTLDSHPSIHALGEVFLYSHGRFPLLRTTGFEVPHSYGEYVAASRSRRVMHVIHRPAVVQAYLDHLYTINRTGVTGFKFMRNQARQFPSVVEYVRKHRVKVIHIVRENVLKTYISRATSRLRKFAHSTEHVPVKQVSISTATLIKRLDRISSDNFAWECEFYNHPYLKVVYEEFIDDQAMQLDRIYSFLSVTPYKNVSSSLVKINPNSIADVVKNLTEVSDVLKGTPYEWCLHT